MRHQACVAQDERAELGHAARKLRDQLVATVDVTVLDDWLGRNEAYDVALHDLYKAISKVRGKITSATRAAVTGDFVLAGSLLGFLRWNFHPATIFAGTSGVMFLGYTLALLSILGIVGSASGSASPSRTPVPSSGRAPRPCCTRRTRA